MTLKEKINAKIKLLEKELKKREPGEKIASISSSLQIIQTESRILAYKDVLEMIKEIESKVK